MLKQWRKKKGKMKLTEITDNNFKEEVVKCELPVLVDCWAEWCVPCKAIEPTIEEIADDYKGRLKVAKLNVEENMRQAAMLRVTSLPTILLLKQGRVVASIVGAVHKKKILAMLERYM